MSKLLELFMEKDLDRFQWLFPKKDMTVSLFMKKRFQRTGIIFIITILLNIVAFILGKHFAKDISPFTYFLISLVPTFLAYKLPYMQLKKKMKTASNKVYQDFPLWISTLEVLIVTNNIPNTLKKSLDTCPASFRNDLVQLVEKIEDEPNKKEHYQEFLSKYNLPDVQEIILDIYQFNFLDKKEIVYEFQALHKKLNKIRAVTRQNKAQTELFLVSILNCIPIFTLCVYLLAVSMLLSNILMG